MIRLLQRKRRRKRTFLAANNEKTCCSLLFAMKLHEDGDEMLGVYLNEMTAHEETPSSSPEEMHHTVIPRMINATT